MRNIIFLWVYRYVFILFGRIMHLSIALCNILLMLHSPAIKENRVTTVQCLSGTGSLRVGAEFLARHYHQVRSFTLFLSFFFFFCFCKQYYWHWWYLTCPPCFPAHYIYSTANMGKSSKNFHFGRIVCEDLPLLWSSNTWAKFPRWALYQ